MLGCASNYTAFLVMNILKLLKKTHTQILGFLSFSSGFQGNSNVSNYIVAVSDELILPFGFIFLFLLSFVFSRVLLGWKLVYVTFIIKPNQLSSVISLEWFIILIFIKPIAFQPFFTMHVRAVNWLIKESTRKMLSFSIKLACIKFAHTLPILGRLHAKWVLQFICKKILVFCATVNVIFSFAPKNSYKRDNQQ